MRNRAFRDNSGVASYFTSSGGGLCFDCKQNIQRRRASGGHQFDTDCLLLLFRCDCAITMMLRTLFGALLLCVGTHARSSGADPSACGRSSMNPSGHPGSTQTSQSPYGIVVSSDRYEAGKSLTITLKGKESFKGFMILALPADKPTGEPIGSFEAKNSAQADLMHSVCPGGNGSTHTLKFKSLKTNLDSLELTWKSSELQGNIVFYVTFVQKLTMYWVKQASFPIWDGVGPKPTSPSSDVTDPPQIAAISRKGCLETKSCYHDCVGNECGYLLTWKKKSKSVVEFELFSTLINNENYVALGLSKGTTMENVSIIACTANTQRDSQVEQYYAITRKPPVYQAVGPINAQDSEASVRTVTTPKTMECRFTYDNTIANSSLDKWKDLNGNLYAFIARGPYAGSLSKHDRAPAVSPSAYHFLSDKLVDESGTQGIELIRAHACLMILAWVFCASVGIILARYYKPMWVDSKACGQKVWFSYHRVLMLAAMFLTIIGFILILIHKKGVIQLPSDLPTRAHPILGLIAFICSLLNPIIAAFRCHPGESKRPIFNWLHWFLGTVAHVFAMVAIITGCMFTDTLNVPEWLWYIPLGFVLYHVLTFEIHQRVSNSLTTSPPAAPQPAHLAVNQVSPTPVGKHADAKYEDRQEDYQMSNKDGKATEPKYAGRGFKCVMLVIYVVFTAIITIALIVFIAAADLLRGVVA